MSEVNKMIIGGGMAYTFLKIKEWNFMEFHIYIFSSQKCG